MRARNPSLRICAHIRSAALAALAALACIAGMSAWAPASGAAGEPDSLAQLAELSLEELMDIEVTSVSRREEPLFEAGAAIFVLTADDLRRSGATSVAEALRLVPGMQVARTNASEWAITVRGFNNQFANKLLVLTDGRSIYTPLFGGVYWDVQDLVLEDIERIEVIRGPGATLWGANAVNGVINIITKSAAGTAGWLVGAGTGNVERILGSVRYGGRASGEVHYRAFGSYHEVDDFLTAGGDPAADGWWLGHGGFRLDWQRRPTDLWTLQGDVYSGEMGRTITQSTADPPFTETLDTFAEVAGGNAIARWTRAFSPGLRTTLQLYFDRTERRGRRLGEERNTLDVDFEQEAGVGRRHQIVWGLGYRMTQDDIDNTFVVSLDPPQRRDHLVSAFVQDEISLVPQRLRLTLGSKFEHNSYTGSEIQPSARVRWTPDRRFTAWGAVSRAVRTPSRVESDVRFVLGTFAVRDTLNVIALVGNPELAADELVAWELGMRLHPVQRLLLDVASFYNVYDELGTIEPGQGEIRDAPPPTHVLRPLDFANLGSGRTWGVELAARWEVTDRIRFVGGYTWLEVEFDREPGSLDASGDIAEGNDPSQQIQLRAEVDLPGSVDVDAMGFYVDTLPGQDIPDYTRLDLRVEFPLAPRLRLTVVGQNLLEPQHPEFGGAVTSAHATEVPRGVYAKAIWRY